MAHPCKCVNCGRQFDRDKVPFIQVSSRRYAHKKCPDGPIDQIEVDKANLNKYLYVLYNGKYDYAPKTINVTIPQPQRKIKKPKKKFSFLDEEEVDVNGK